MTTDSQADAQGETKPGTLQALAVYGERRSLVMLSNKKVEDPWRKHGNIPL